MKIKKTEKKHKINRNTFTQILYTPNQITENSEMC